LRFGCFAAFSKTLFLGKNRVETYLNTISFYKKNDKKNQKSKTDFCRFGPMIIWLYVVRFWAFLGEGRPKDINRKNLTPALFWPLNRPPTTVVTASFFLPAPWVIVTG
jgi:hypothetical protein